MSDQNIFEKDSPYYSEYEAWIKNGGLKRAERREEANRKADELERLSPSGPCDEFTDSSGRSLTEGNKLAVRIAKGQYTHFGTYLQDQGFTHEKHIAYGGSEVSWVDSCRKVSAVIWRDADRVVAVDTAVTITGAYTGDILGGSESMNSRFKTIYRITQVAEGVLNGGELKVISTGKFAELTRRVLG